MKRPIDQLLYLVVLFHAVSLYGGWELFEDFESGLDGWVSNDQPLAIIETVVDPMDPGNSVLKIDSNAYGVTWGITFLLKELPKQIPEGEKGSFYYRVYIEGPSNNYGLGLVDTPLVVDPGTGFMTTPSNWTDYEPLITPSGSGAYSIRNGNSYVTPPQLPGLTVGQWYEFWILVDNATGTLDDVSTTYYMTDGMSAPVLLQIEEKDADGNVTNTYDTALFRNGTTDPLTGFMIGTVSGDPAAPVTGDLMFIDDIYLDYAGENLDSPLVVQEWMLVDDFESGIDGWISNGQANAIINTQPDPQDSTNSVLMMDSNSYGVDWGITFLAKELPVEIPEGSSGTFYYRVFLEGISNNYGLGLIDTPIVVDPGTGFMTTPSNWTDYEPLITPSGNGVYNIRNGNSYATPPELPGLTVGQWYEFWIFASNAEGTLDDESSTYFRTTGMTNPELLHIEEKDADGNVTNTYDTALFRNGTTDSLSGFMVGTVSGDPAAPVLGDLMYVDDIYISIGGKNMTSPVKGEDGMSWAGYSVTEDGLVDTGDWIGWLYLDSQTDWVLSYTLQGWIYFPEPAEGVGGWAYIAK